MNSHFSIKNLLFIASISVVLFSCQTQQINEPHDNKLNSETITKAICVLYPTKGNHVNGIVQFTKTDTGIIVEAHMKGLSPGDHGFHIHEFGDCSAPDGISTGGHFNPHDMKHGAQTGEIRHVGDFGNITALDDSSANLKFVDTVISFTGENSIIGRGIIVHAKADDLESQPTGNAGSRVACGVIGIAK